MNPMRWALSTEVFTVGFQSSDDDLPVVERDCRLREFFETYLETEKHRQFSAAAITAFLTEQAAQLALPPKQQNWEEARRLYLAMFNIDDAKMAKIKGGLFSGGWIGAGSLYALTSQPMSFASTVPSLYTATVPTQKLLAHLTHYSKISLIAQIVISFSAPLINSALQIVMVARQALMRSERGQPTRAREMKAQDYIETDRELRSLIGEMRVLEDAVAAHEREIVVARHLPSPLLPSSSPENEDRLLVSTLQQQLDIDQDALRGYSARLQELRRQFNVRKAVIDLNYTAQRHPSMTRALRSLITLSGQVISNSTHSRRAGGLIQVLGSLFVMCLTQLWAAPTGHYQKWDSLLMFNVRTATVPVLPRDSGAEAKGESDNEEILYDVTDLRKQWKGPISVRAGQFKECLETDLAFAKQSLASLKEGKKSAKAEASMAETAERVSTLENDMDCLASDRWLNISAANRGSLLRAVSCSAGADWRLSLRTARARALQPAELIAQIAQRVGNQFAMFVFGSNMQLIVSMLIRLLNAQRAEAGLPPAVSPSTLYAINAVLALTSMIMAFSVGSAVCRKIVQRAELKKRMGGKVGVRLEEIPRGLGAVLRAMFALPTAAWERARVQGALGTATRVAGQLSLRLHVMRIQVEA